MPERRPFPPSPRRRALARQAGLTGASPLLVGAAAIGAAAAASAMLARAAASMLGRWLAAACDHAGSAGASGDHAPLLAANHVVRAVLDIAAPLLGIAAIAAIAVHLAQTRGIWLPRRRIEGAPALPADAGARSRHAAFELVAATVVAVTAFGWLWTTAPRLARLVDEPATAAGVAATSAQAALAVAAFRATIAIAGVALGALDALLRHAGMGRALSMTAEEKREDDRLTGADPRWRARRAELARADARGASAREAIAASTVLLVGDDLAVAIAWDPVRRPTPARIAAGRGPLATQLLAHARRQALPVHRDAALAAALAPDLAAVTATSVAGAAATGLAGARAIADAHWPRLAEIVAATRGR